MAANQQGSEQVAGPGRPSPGFSSLTLGWRVEGDLHEPAYWTKPGARPGGQTDDDLYRVPAEAMAHHTVIVAQSGSGKSFFLGRLIEEVALRTRARCLILDPNADFRKISQVEDDALWDAARYDVERRRGKLPHEAVRTGFEPLWSRVSVRVRTNQAADGPEPYERLRIWWPALAVAFLAEDLDPMLRGELRYCHDLMGDLANLLQFKAALLSKQYNLVDEFQRVVRLARAMPHDDFAAMLGNEFPVAQWEQRMKRARRDPGELPDEDYFDEEMSSNLWKLGLKRSSVFRQLGGTGEALDLGGLDSRIREFIRRAQGVGDSVSHAVERFYLEKLREALRDGILKSEVGDAEGTRGQPRLDVVDLPSLSDKNARSLAINAIVASEWDRARQAWSEALEASPGEDRRVPTFVVADEAHNLMPARVRSRAEAALREQFRTLAAEGRKYGLFLVLVSQRPDKLDPLVLSECENRAIMRLGSRSVLDHARKLLGLEDVEALDACLTFRTGRVLLCGPWARDGRPAVLFSAARRTVEGGRNLRTSYWASPEPEAPPDAPAPAQGPTSGPSPGRS
jgi:DNA helicase HerA-like ATPase